MKFCVEDERNWQILISDNHNKVARSSNKMLTNMNQTRLNGGHRKFICANYSPNSPFSLLISAIICCIISTSPAGAGGAAGLAGNEERRMEPRRLSPAWLPSGDAGENAGPLPKAEFICGAMGAKAGGANLGGAWPDNGDHSNVVVREYASAF